MKELNNFLKLIVRQALKFYYLFPINNKKIFILSFGGSAIYGFDGKALIEYSNENKLGYEFIWGLKKGEEPKTKIANVKFVRYTSIKGLYYMLTSKFFITNINPPSYIPFRKKQKIINTWHGFAYKKVGKYAPNFDERQFNLSTCFTSHSQSYTDMVLKDSFCFKGSIFNCGCPRNDIFFNSNQILNAANKVKKQYNVEGKKILLYAPTFRNKKDFVEAEINYSELKNDLACKFGGEWVIFERMHPMITKHNKVNNIDVIDVSLYPDMQELLCASDILISDYSSCMWDFSLLKRPVFVYASDIEEYSKNRGLYVDIKKWPYIICLNNSDLKNSIKQFNNEQYQEKIKEYFNRENKYDEGKSCYEIFKYIEDGEK